MTLDTYGHLMPDVHDRAVEVLEEIAGKFSSNVVQFNEVLGANKAQQENKEDDKNPETCKKPPLEGGGLVVETERFELSSKTESNKHLRA